MKYSCVRLHCVIHKNSLLLNQHNGDDPPQKKNDTSTRPPSFAPVDIQIPSPMRCASLRLRCVYHEDEIPKYLCSVLACTGPTRSLGISVLGGVPGCSHTPRYEQCHKNYVFSLPSVGTRRRTVAAPQARPSNPATTYSPCSNKCYSSICSYSTSLFQHSNQVRHLSIVLRW